VTALTGVHRRCGTRVLVVRNIMHRHTRGVSCLTDLNWNVNWNVPFPLYISVLLFTRNFPQFVFGFSLLAMLHLAPSCSSIPPCRTSVRSLASATVSLGTSITCCETSARSFRSAFGLLQLSRMPSAAALCR
jgi:hypothetical protein